MTVSATPFGPAAFDALATALRAVRGGDPLLSVDVAVPSSFVGVTVRRRFANPGLVGVRFTSLPRIIAERAAPVLAAQGRERLSSSQRRAVTRGVLCVATGRVADAARHSSATVNVVAGVFAELDEADTDLTGAKGPHIVELASLYDTYRGRITDVADPRAVVDAALATASPTPLIVYLPRRLKATELAFCRGLAADGLLHVVVGLTGEKDTDADAHNIAQHLSPGIEMPKVTASANVLTKALPDAEEEVRQAVRRLLDHLQQHPQTRADRLAVAFRAATPYARLLSEQLSAAGLPFHAPRQRSLAQTIGGRTVLGLLGLPDEQWSRTAVMDWLRDCPIRDGKLRLPVNRWQQQAAEAGVTRGMQQWARKLEHYASSLPKQEEWQRERAQQARDLTSFMAALIERLASLESAQTWAESAAELRATVDRYLGGPNASAGWAAGGELRNDEDVRARSDVERDAYEQVSAAIDTLALLDDVDAAYSPSALRDVLGQELDRHVTETKGLGRGVLVGPLWDLAGADLDLLVIVGASEGAYPPRGREHALVRDDARAASGLRTLEDRRRSERRDHLAALASAPEVVLTHPVADVRAQRGAEPAPWLLEQIEPRLLAREEKATAPASFQASVLDDDLPPSTESEYDVRAVLGAALGDEALAELSPDLVRGLDESRARIRAEFGSWTGALSHPLSPELQQRLEERLSASSLQRYAGCGFQFFLKQVLNIKVVDEPDETRPDAAERGTQVHDVLEQLINRSPNRDPDLAWSEEDHAWAQDLLTQKLDTMLAEGKAGRPQVWAVECEVHRRQLHRMMLADDTFRATRRAWPVAAEHTFGRADHEGSTEPLALDLPSGEVLLGGSIDRVDLLEDGSLIITDYKTGRSDNFATFPKNDTRDGKTDFVDRGNRLQLPLYALAAQRDFNAQDKPVSAYYAFVDEAGLRRGASLEQSDFGRLHEVVDTISAGIRDGAFPLHPGDYSAFYGSFKSCSWCDFHRVCPVARDDLWEGIRADDRVQAYADVVEPSQEQQ